MKKMILIATGILLMTSLCFAEGGSSSAGAGAPRNIPSEILNHTIVMTLGNLLNEKHDKQCVVPTTERDIHWMCLGALPQVTQPTIIANSCGFLMTIECPGEKATIVGQTVSYSVLNPAGQRSTVTPTPTQVIINSVRME